MNKPFKITDLLNEIYQGFEDQHDREFIRITTRKYFKEHKILPTDKEVEKWFEQNIKKNKIIFKGSASRAILKFRSFLKSRLKN